MKKRCGCFGSRLQRCNGKFLVWLLAFPIFFTMSGKRGLAQNSSQAANVPADARSYYEDVTHIKSSATAATPEKLYGGINSSASKDAPLKIYPDPVSDYLLVVKQPSDVVTSVTVLSLIGNVVLTDAIQPGTTTSVFDVKNIPHGIYVIILESRNEKQTMRFIKS